MCLPLLLQTLDTTSTAQHPFMQFGVTDRRFELSWNSPSIIDIGRSNSGCTGCTITHHGIGLTKRAVIIEQAVFNGLKAAKFLLKEAKSVGKEDKLLGANIKEFQKTGGYLRAYTDFRALAPSNVRDLGWPGYTRLMGRVGDRVLILHHKGFTNASMLEIIKDQSGPEMSIIYYIDL